MNDRFSLGSGGGYFFIWMPRETAASTSISNAMVSVMLMGVASFRGGWPPPLLALMLSYLLSIVKPLFEIIFHPRQALHCLPGIVLFAGGLLL